MIALLDGDIYAFRAACSAEQEDAWVACARVDTMINNTLDELGVDKYSIFLSGKNNFRYEIFPEYKANRKDKPRPKWEMAVKNYMADQWEAEIVDGMEADDALGINQTSNTIICTIDKDPNQIAGWHYNFVKKEKYLVEEEEGIRYFWKQVLMGDGTDGIRGVRGIGVKKSEAILYEMPLSQMYSEVKGHFGTLEDFEKTAGCIWIRRKGGTTWREYLKIDETGISESQGQSSTEPCTGQDPGDVS